MARVSIIMGIYNCADTLAEAIESLLAQTYSDWKLIMCDDGSSDHTYDVAKQYADNYPNEFVLITNERNMGLNATLNHCLKYADSEYVARMDGDDISVPSRLEKEVDFLDKHPEYAIVSSSMKYFDREGVFREGKGRGEPRKESFVHGTPFCHAPCMVRKEAYDKVGGYTVKEELLRVEDWHLWIKMYAAGYKGYELDESLYMMRDDRNATARRKLKYRFNESRVIQIAIKELGLSKKNYIFMLRPILVGLLPTPIYHILHRKKVTK